MAKVESLSHTHLVRNESTGTALQPLADQDPSREELEYTYTEARTDGQKDRHTDKTRCGECRGRQPRSFKEKKDKGREKGGERTAGENKIES